MFQISYAVFVLIVGVVVGLFLSADASGTGMRRPRNIALTIAGLVLLGFFVRFGLLWGVVTIVELFIGAAIGWRLGGRDDKKREKVEQTRSIVTPADVIEPRRSGSRPTESNKASSLGTNVLWTIGALLVFGVILQGYFAAQRLKEKEALEGNGGAPQPSTQLMLPEYDSQVASSAEHEISMDDDRLDSFLVTPITLPFQVHVAVDGTRYRKAPFATFDTPILAFAARGDPLSVTGKVLQSDGVWFRVAMVDGRIGYIRSDLVSFKPSETKESDVKTQRGNAQPAAPFDDPF